MTTALITHPDGLQHITPPGHPERVDRLMAIYAAIDGMDQTGLRRVEAPMGTDEAILRCHPQSHIDAVTEAAPAEGTVALDADTHMSPGSLRAAYRGVGAMTTAVDIVIKGDVQNAFAAMRPPGHHAEKTTPMGFCLFGNIAIAAKHALDVHGLERVAIVDFDVHHGNGTQDLLWDEERTLFISSHQMPLYPGSGAPSERGAHENILNVPLDPHTGGVELRLAYERMVFPALDEFKPQLVLISAGFDAHRNDPLANLNWDEADFTWVTEQLCDVADTYAQGRVVSTLEGGYDLDGLAASTRAHLQVLIQRGTHG
ncbi:acetoin utilization deacetylase AcuC-like enzyme [Litoreibacter ponti]|uniref:Acetoin utilization deacetylase AcuC-like enzyme n=1 Tax=Litoreibacter ponti TaxID=1510457 RepID=A0A2T6BPM8_9RHOB|nr:histone deacetylase family protein [Litoreibacter ponti]PTX58029.1 acetoin utilization deacetylase AcuC-like enzyme [Litoreibacter ponti]